MKTFFFALLLSVGFILLTVKSAKGKVPQPQPEAVPKPSANKPRKPQKQARASTPKMQNFKQNSPKNEGYFTYETLEPENSESLPTTLDAAGLSVENYQQITENEQQKNINLELSEEEIKKGIVYSIILERPDF